MVTQRRSRLVELELLLIPSLLITSGMALVILVSRGSLYITFWDVWPSAAFVVALLAIHVFLVLRRFRGDQVLLPAVAMLTGIGLVMMQRLDSTVTGGRSELAGIAARQTLWVFIGLAVFLVTLLKFDVLYRLRAYKYTAAVFGIVLMAAVLVPGLGVERGGARLWYNFGFFLFQPSELVKVILVFFFAAYLDERRDLLASEYRLGPLKLPPLPYLMPMLMMWGLSMLVLVVLNDFGGALLFFAIFVSMLYALTGRALYVWVLGLAFLGGAYVANQMFAHVHARVAIWLSPWSDPYDRGYQIVQSLFALASGGVYGSGLGFGSPKLMSAVHTDMVFSAIAEELGLIGALGVLALYLVLMYRGFYVSLTAKRGFYQLLGIGLTTIFGVQSIIIIGGDLKLFPLTGITLPFVAYGGSSIVTNYMMLAILMGISDSSEPAR